MRFIVIMDLEESELPEKGEPADYVHEFLKQQFGIVLNFLDVYRPDTGYSTSEDIVRRSGNPVE